MSDVEHNIWAGEVVQVDPTGFIADLYDDGLVVVDKIIPGVEIGMNVVFYTTGEMDENGHAYVECEFTKGKELPN